jgi:hypothetical protein
MRISRERWYTYSQARSCSSWVEDAHEHPVESSAGLGSALGLSAWFAKQFWIRLACYQLVFAELGSIGLEDWRHCVSIHVTDEVSIYILGEKMRWLKILTIGRTGLLL